jgi:hypothetical protein
MSMMPDKINKTLEEKAAQRQLDLQPVKTVVMWLNQQEKELRILVDRANGLGHHTATLNLMRRMIALGFNQTIRIFYDPGDASKLQLLIPGFTANNGELQPNMQLKGVTLAFSFYGNGNVPKDKAPLLICGGSESKERGRRLAEFNVEYYLQLQPYAWGKSKGSDNFLVSSQGEIGLDKLNFTSVGGIFYCHGFYQSLPSYNPDIWNSYTSVPRFAESMAKANILRTLGDKLWFAPAYGLQTRTDLATSLFNYTAALLRLQDLIKTVEKKDFKPFVVVAFDDLAGIWDDLTARFNGTHEAMPDNLKRYLQQNPLLNRVILYQGTSNNLNNALLNLSDNQVMVISMPNTPSDIFNWLYAQTYVAPGVFEGRGTLNLAFNMGLPYFCMDAEKAYPSTDSFTVNQSAIGGIIRSNGIDNLNANLDKYDGVNPDKFPFALLAQTMLSMNYPASLTKNNTLKYFNQLTKMFHDERYDKLVLGLIIYGKAIKILRQPKSSSPSTADLGEGGKTI